MMRNLSAIRKSHVARQHSSIFSYVFSDYLIIIPCRSLYALVSGIGNSTQRLLPSPSFLSCFLFYFLLHLTLLITSLLIFRFSELCLNLNLYSSLLFSTLFLSNSEEIPHANKTPKNKIKAR